MAYCSQILQMKIFFFKYPPKILITINFVGALSHQGIQPHYRTKHLRHTSSECYGDGWHQSHPTMFMYIEIIVYTLEYRTPMTNQITICTVQYIKSTVIVKHATKLWHFSITSVHHCLIQHTLPQTYIGTTLTYSQCTAPELKVTGAHYHVTIPSSSYQHITIPSNCSPCTVTVQLCPALQKLKYWCSCMLTDTQTHTWTYTLTQVHMHTCVHTYTPIHTHIYTHTHTHTHTRILPTT